MLRFFKPINGVQWLTFVLGVLVVAGFIYGFAKLNAVQAHENDGLHSVICTIEAKELHPRVGSDPTVAQRRQIIKFWNEELSVAHLRSCS